jgi:Tfp pilus assembly PilM family ATPase
MISRIFKDMLIPERLGNYYLIPQRIVGIDIGKTAVRATRILYRDKTMVIEKTMTQAIETDLSVSYADRLAQALGKILEIMKPYDIIRTSLPSSMVVFKELTFPFQDIDKITKIISFEIEPFLPFSSAQAAISFIVTKQDATQTTLIAAAATHENIAEYSKPFVQAGAPSAIVSIDMFDLYGLYHALYKTESKTTVLIDIDTHITRIIYIVQGQLKFSRILTKGITSVAKTLAQSLDTTPGQAMESLIRFGCQETGKSGYCQAVEAALTEFFKDVRFTIDSFMAQLDSMVNPSLALLLGPGAEPTNVVSYAQKILAIPCELLETTRLTSDPSIKIAAGTTIDQEQIMSTAAALETSVTRDINLNSAYQEHQETIVFKKQIIAAAVLFPLIFMVLGVHFWWQTSTLRQAAMTAERGIITALRKEGLSSSNSVSRALDEAQEVVKNREEVWFAFSAQTRFSFLKYLQALSTAIDRVGLGLRLQRLAINQRENLLTLSGEVQDYEALTRLEQDLRETGVFVHVPSLPKTKFDIELRLKKSIQE